jgi:hypothetical protein
MTEEDCGQVKTPASAGINPVYQPHHPGWVFCRPEFAVEVEKNLQLDMRRDIAKLLINKG